MDDTGQRLYEDTKVLLSKLEGNTRNHKALRYVVELHTFVQVTKGKSGLRKRCTECGFAFPCPTVQGIKDLIK